MLVCSRQLSVTSALRGQVRSSFWCAGSRELTLHLDVTRLPNEFSLMSNLSISTSGCREESRLGHGVRRVGSWEAWREGGRIIIIIHLVGVGLSLWWWFSSFFLTKGLFLFSRNYSNTEQRRARPISPRLLPSFRGAFSITPCTARRCTPSCDLQSQTSWTWPRSPGAPSSPPRTCRCRWTPRSPAG